ncbi:hypothetical protein V6N11_046369 [Hibiscus sabdariffa]|uniref:Uncharacterized protein n=1 Tax=Hibiscus sabdariffa TaxID=183260 RepID=A0ABR2P1Z3_9ROSI
MEIALFGEARSVTEVGARVRDSVDGRFNALAHGLAVRRGLSLAVERSHPVAACSGGLATALYVGNAWHQIVDYDIACYRRIGRLGCTGHRHAHDKHQGSQL